jgi:chromosome segregation ATPase
MEVGSIRETKLLDAAFKGLWERVRKATELITGLREENKTLRADIAQLKGRIQELEGILRLREENIQDLKTQQLQIQSNNNSPFTEEEREALKLRIKDLLAKLNSHL